MATNALLWVKWQYDTGSPVVKSSYNTSSVTNITTASWQISSSVATSDGNYAILGTASNNGMGANWGMCINPDVTYTNTTTTSRYWTGNGSTGYNSYVNSIALFGN